MTSGDRVFGFEINASWFTTFNICEVMLTDVTNKAHYQDVVALAPNLAWAQTDPSLPWKVDLANQDSPTWIHMSAAVDPAENMVVNAGLLDSASPETPITLSLSLSQQGLLQPVWGVGVHPLPPPPPNLQKSNFYYSFTRLQATGTITIAGESFPVSGVTWMDHEYGFFGSATDRITWFLQIIQLPDGTTIHHYHTFETNPETGQKLSSEATIQFADGTLYYVENCTMIPGDHLWRSPTGKTYFLSFEVLIPDFNASFTVRSSVEPQIFEWPGNVSEVYEGVATASGVFNGEPVTGTAWIEQQL